MKNLSSKLFGGLAVAALVIGSFATSNAEVQTVTVNDLTIEDVNAQELDYTSDIFVACGSKWCAIYF